MTQFTLSEFELGDDRRVVGRALASAGFLVDVARSANVVHQSVGQDQVEIAFDVVGKPVKMTVLPAWLTGGLVRLVGMLSTQFGDLAEFIVRSGEVDGVGPMRGTITVREYFEALEAGRPDV